MLYELKEVVVEVVIEPEVRASVQEIRVKQELEFPVEQVEFWGEVASKKDIGNRNHKSTTPITRVEIRFRGVHVIKLGDRRIKGCEDFDVSQWTGV